jgi:hypothetical protein
MAGAHGPLLGVHSVASPVMRLKASLRGVRRPRESRRISSGARRSRANLFSRAARRALATMVALASRSAAACKASRGMSKALALLLEGAGGARSVPRKEVVCLWVSVAREGLAPPEFGVPARHVDEPGVAVGAHAVSLAGRLDEAPMRGPPPPPVPSYSPRRKGPPVPSCPPLDASSSTIAPCSRTLWGNACCACQSGVRACWETCRHEAPRPSHEAWASIDSRPRSARSPPFWPRVKEMPLSR